MSSSATWLLTILAAMIFSSVLGYADRSARSVNILDRNSGREVPHGEGLHSNKDNRIASGPSGRPSDPDYYLWNLLSERPAQSGPTYYDAALPSDASLEPWSPSQLQAFSRPTGPAQLGSADGPSLKTKREGHSLSIVNPLDVLRQRMMLEMARRRMKENQEQIKANDVILKTLGKRQGSQDDSDCDEDEDNGPAKRRGTKDERRRSQRQDYFVTRQDGLPEEFVV